MGFYDELADSYDAITGAAGRAGSTEAFIDGLLKRRDVRSAVDAACGTGLFALALARRGIRTVGADISPGMLDKARQASADADLPVTWLHAPMQALAAELDGPFDAVICMGNSLPHLLDDADLDATIAGFAALLAPGGLLALHLLNYAQVLADRERIVGVTRDGDTQYVRFYDFLHGRVRFNILEIEWQGDACRTQLNGTDLRPYVLDDLSGALTRHGLTDAQAFGDLAFSPFDPESSGSLLVTARI